MTLGLVSAFELVKVAKVAVKFVTSALSLTAAVAGSNVTNNIETINNKI